MPYELRLNDGPCQTFDTEEEAVAPDVEVDIWDTTTGKPAAPGASKSWREEIARKIGF
jgi:hypothetical protein